MAAVTNTNNLTGLARAMVNHGWLSEDDAEGVWKRASQSGDSFVTELIKGRRFKADQVAEFAAVSFGFPYLDLNAMDHENLPHGLLDPKLVQKRRVVALYQRGNKLYVATSDPTHLQALDEVKFQTGQTVEPVVVEDDKLGKLIEKAGEANDNTMAVLNAEDLNLDFADEESAAQQDTGGIEIDDAPVVRYLQKIMLDAINIGASSISTVSSAGCCAASSEEKSRLRSSVLMADRTLASLSVICVISLPSLSSSTTTMSTARLVWNLISSNACRLVGSETATASRLPRW